MSGLTNVNYRITKNGERFMLRVSGKNTQRLGIDRNHELAALQAASAAGIGPEVLAFLLPEGHLITRWIDGRHWKAEEFRTPEHIRQLTGIVKRLHALPPNGATFSPFRRVELFQETARDFGVPFPPDFNDFLEPMHRIQAEQQCDQSDWLRFCHNDLVSVNYLYCVKDDSIKVLDWEFAGMGDIYYDLATVVYTHDNIGPVPTELEEVMLACYFGKVTDKQRRRLQGMKYMLMLFNSLWGLAQHGMQTAGLIAPVEGFDYLEFAQYLFDHDLKELRSTL
jgi:thiamine kinase-like enzyme